MNHIISKISKIVIPSKMMERSKKQIAESAFNLVEKVLEPLGFFSDKPFKPHITIFRIKKKVGDITKELDRQKMIDFGMQEVTNIKLKKSELTPDGPIYSDIEEIKALK